MKKCIERMILPSEACHECDALTMTRVLKNDSNLHYVECTRYLSAAAATDCFDIIKLLINTSCGREMENEDKLRVIWKEAALKALEAGYSGVHDHIMKKLIKEDVNEYN